MFTIALVGYVALNEGIIPGQPGRMQHFEATFKGRSIEEGAILYQNNCTGCHGIQGRGIPGVAPALNSADLFDGSRLKSVGYAGSLESYLYGAISAGRPVKSNPSYPQPMPTWGQQFGGPMRGDQVLNLVAFILNWQESALAEGPVASPTPAMPVGGGVGADLSVTLPTGNAANGQELFEAPYGCSACHSLEADKVIVGPSLAGIANLATTRKSGYDAAKYIHESIVQPKSFMVQGFADVMPVNFGERMSAQDLADIIAFLLEQK
jgi:cytochrome c2